MQSVDSNLFYYLACAYVNIDILFTLKIKQFNHRNELIYILTKKLNITKYSLKNWIIIASLIFNGALSNYIRSTPIFQTFFEKLQ